MKGYSNIVHFSPEEVELHRQATFLVEHLPEVPWTRCHELTRAIAIAFRHSPLKLSVVDGKFGIVDHSWIHLNRGGSAAILDVYSVGSLPMVQLHDVDTIGLRGARAYVAGLPRDDIDITAVEARLHDLGLIKNAAETLTFVGDTKTAH